MNKHILTLLLLLGLFLGCTPKSHLPQAANKADAVVAALRYPQSRYVVVVSHRGDWRNYPENSLPAIESVIGGAEEPSALFESYISQAVSDGSKVWVNTIWASLCGGYDDDRAFESEDPATVYDRILDLGTSIIQTDRPELLIRYLEEKGRR